MSTNMFTLFFLLTMGVTFVAGFTVGTLYERWKEFRTYHAEQEAFLKERDPINAHEKQS